MLAELLQEVKKQAELANRPDIAKVDQRNVLICQGGEYEFHQLAPPWRKMEVHTLEDLVGATSDLRCPDHTPTIWHSFDSVIGFIGPEQNPYGEQVCLWLPCSTPWNYLQAHEERDIALHQMLFIDLLRTKLCDYEPGDLLTKIRTIQFSSKNAGSSDVQHGQDTLGRSVEREMSGAGDIPQDVTFNLPMYQTTELDSQVSIRCALSIDLENQMFRLNILPRELFRAKEVVQKRLRSRLESLLEEHAEIGLYFGYVSGD